MCTVCFKTEMNNKPKRVIDRLIEEYELSNGRIDIYQKITFEIKKNNGNSHSLLKLDEEMNKIYGKNYFEKLKIYSKKKLISHVSRANEYTPSWEYYNEDIKEYSKIIIKKFKKIIFFSIAPKIFYERTQSILMNTNSYNKQQLLKILKHSKIDHLLLSFNLDNFRDFEKNTFLHLALINNFLQTITTAKLTLRFKMTAYGSIKYKIFCKYMRKWLQKYCSDVHIIMNYDGDYYFDSNRCFARDFLKDKRVIRFDTVVINKMQSNNHRNLNLNLRILKK